MIISIRRSHLTLVNFMIRLSKNVIYLCEGKCEETLLKNLKAPINKYCKIIPGKVKVYNIFQTPVKAIVSNLDKKCDTIIIFDSDVISTCGTNALVSNLDKIRSFSKNIYIVIQYQNLEDELMKAFNIKQRDLHGLYNAQGNKEFKASFISCKNNSAKFESNEFNIDLFCNHNSSPIQSEAWFNELNDYNVIPFSILLHK